MLVVRVSELQGAGLTAMEDPYRILEVPPGASAGDVRRAWRRLAKRLHPDAGGDAAAMAAVNGAYERLRTAGGTKASDREGWFTLDVLPVEAFHLVEVAVAELGEVLSTDEPYGIDGYLTEPAACFCRCELVPEAGGTIVTVTVEPAEDVVPPSASAVVDVLVAAVIGR